MLVLATFAFAPACLETEVSDTRGTGGAGGSGGTNPSGGSAGGNPSGGGTTPAEPYAGIAVASSELPAGGGAEPGSVYVTFGASTQLACGKDPYDPMLTCPGWNVYFTLPPALQQPGIVPLSDPRLNAGHSMTAQNSGAPAGDCYFGGGSFGDGNLEVLTLGNGQLRLRITDAPELGFDPNGEHLVQLCSAIAPPKGPRALAYRQDAIPPLDPTPSGTTVATTTGGGPDPDDLMLVITKDNGAQNLSCSVSPFESTCPKASWTLYLDLPVAKQKPGTYSLAELNGFSSETFEGSTPDDCGGGGGSFFDGTLEVVSFENGSVVVELAGAGMVAGDDTNGSYTMSICE